MDATTANSYATDGGSDPFVQLAGQLAAAGAQLGSAAIISGNLPQQQTGIFGGSSTGAATILGIPVTLVIIGVVAWLLLK